ncbi:trichohyalin isoform X2 [Drosophila willistoni]|uniref:trichohyalin isoform X2 n=1 Tax=Drosophila willistoni TaxID=7260 RepID=UPI001F084116|nr:trichohyalin isoform X2 [Drosophila willistoni]
MISILWWIMLFLVSGLQSQEIGQSQKLDKTGNEKLLNFHHAVNEARQELEDLKSSYDEGLDSATDHRQRRNSIDDMLASFAQDAPKSCNEEAAASAGSGQDEKALQMAADAWFRDIQASLSKRQSQVQAKESNTASKQVRAAPGKDHAKNFYNNYEKAMERTEIGKVKLKYKNVPEDTIIMQSERTRTPYQEEDSHAATQLDIKLKQVQQLLHDHEEKLERQRLYKSNNDDKVNVKTSESVEKLPQYGDGPIPEGVYEQTLARLNFPHLPLKANNLSHEANYKLSKIEQEASEQASKNPIRYPFKRSSSSNFNPMNEIKLKTSSRLMRRGMGPSLPSNSLTDSRRSHLVDDMIRRRERQMQQRDQREQSQLEEHEDSIMPQQYEAFSNSNLDGSDSIDSPQSYDYRLPQYEQFHSLNQRTNMRDYSRVKDYERFKREPEGKITEKLQENDADQTEDTKLESKDQQNHQEKESSDANKGETSLEEHHQDEEKSIETPIKDETKEENKLESSKSDIEAENEAKSDSENDSSLHSSKTAIAKNKEDDSMLRLNMKLKLEDPLKSAAATEEASAVAAQPTKVDPCKASQSIKVNSDAVVKLLANEMLQFKTDKERGKRAIRKTRRRHQPIEEQQQSQQEEHRRSKRSVVDSEDHNGNHMHAGSLSNAPLTSDAEGGARNGDEDDEGAFVDFTPTATNLSIGTATASAISTAAATTTTPTTTASSVQFSSKFQFDSLF